MRPILLNFLRWLFARSFFIIISFLAFFLPFRIFLPWKISIFSQSWYLYTFGHTIIQRQLIELKSGLVNLLELLPPLLLYRLVDPVLVVVECLWWDIQLKVWELGKHYIVQVVPFQGKSPWIIQSLVNKLALFLVNYVVITYQLLISLPFTHLVGFWRDTAGDKSVCDSYESILNEIHLVYLLIFIVNHHVVLVVLKTPRDEALCDLK